MSTLESFNITLNVWSSLNPDNSNDPVVELTSVADRRLGKAFEKGQKFK